MKQIFCAKQIAALLLTTVTAILLTAVLSSSAHAITVENSSAALDCATATAELSSAQTTYFNAQKQLNQAQQKCNGDFNCIYPYQSAFTRAQASLSVAQNAVTQACK